MAAARVDRRLAAVLAADVVGYSRLIEHDEQGTLERLKALRQGTIEPILERHGGRIVKLMGDGALVEFASASEAVQAAVEVQEAVAGHEPERPTDERIRFRIGISLGDVVHEDGDIFGEGVNLAARLETLAARGGICVTRNVYEQARNRLPIAFAPMGRHRVKNIAEPVEVWRVAAGGRRRRAWQGMLRRLSIAAALALVVAAGALGSWWLLRAPPPPTPDATPSLAVLPFDNMSGDAALDYFSDGLTEDLTTQLSRFPELRVAARNSAFTYKGSAIDVRQAARELGVRFVLEGSVRSSGETARITAQLIDGTSGHHLWAERFDEEGSDVFALQDRVTQKVVTAVVGERGQIRLDGYRDAFGKPRADLAEYDYFLRVHALIYRFTKEDFLEAQRVAREGLARFPDSGLLRIKLGWTHLNTVRFEWSTDRERDLSEAYRLAVAGLAVRGLPSIGRLHGHWLLAQASVWHKRDFDKAMVERERALALAPHDADVFGDLCDVLSFGGRPGEVTRLLPPVLAANPTFAALGWPYWTLAFAYFNDRHYEQAVAEARRPAEPDRVTVAASLAALGRVDEARCTIQEQLTADPTLSIFRVRLRSPFKNEADLDHLLGNLRKAGLPEGVQAGIN